MRLLLNSIPLLDFLGINESAYFNFIKSAITEDKNNTFFHDFMGWVH